MDSIGKNIAERRRALGLTQEQVAEKVGVSAQAISKWENDLTEPDARMLLTLADLFGTSVDDLLRGTSIPTVATDSKRPEDRTVKVCISATDEDMRAIVRIPAALFLEGDFSAFDENGVLAKKKLIEPIEKFLKSNTVGDIIDVVDEGDHITVTIE